MQFIMVKVTQQLHIRLCEEWVIGLNKKIQGN
jgi:hypothetical protein